VELGHTNWVDDKPLDDLMESSSVKLDEWVPSAQSLMKYNPKAKKPGEGQVWGFPIMGNPGAAFIFYNKDVLDKAGVGVPTDETTLSELTEMARGVKENLGVFGIQENLWGTTHGLGWDHGYVSPFGGYILDDEGKKCLINSAECLEAYNWQYNLRHVEKVEGTPDDVTAYGSYPGCEKGAVAMYKMGAWGAGWFLLRPENKNPEMGFSLFPSSWDGNADGRRETLNNCTGSE
jgi:ABC-type glycerol-3-phosphate transport system substrate-binding protein